VLPFGLQFPDTGDGAEVLLTAIAFPMIGITIQGLHIAIMSLTRRLFEDPARKAVGAQVKAVFAQVAASTAQVPAGEEPPADVDWAFLQRASNDACFVWLYHSCAGPDMIEWARRRRSYYYLGINWVAAAVLGLLAGFYGDDLTSVGAQPILVLAALVWAAGAIVLALRMRRDADSMEAIWAAAIAHPELRERLTCMLPLGRGRSA
jgi:hypothetical protein